MTVAAYLALGSNVGDRKAHLDAAVAALAGTPGVVVCGLSSYHETAPVGGPSGQGAFLNAAAAVETTLGPRELLGALRAIETRAGRLREFRWGERTLDVDLLLHGDCVLDEPGLIVPHPRMVVRRFVLAPLAELAPGAVEPVTGLTAAELLANLDRRPSFVCLSWPPADVFRRVAEGLGAVGLFDGTLSPDSYMFQRDDLAGDHDFFAILARKAAEFEAGRWSSEVWGDRWVISDFWIHHIAQDVAFWLSGEDLERWRESFVEVSRLVIRPTFLVGPPDSLGHMRAWAQSHPDAILGGGRIPAICPGYDHPSRFAQKRGPDEIPTGPEDDPTLRDIIVAEILAACAASRP